METDENGNVVKPEGGGVSALSGQDVHRKSRRTDTRGRPVEKGGDHHLCFVDENAPGTPIHEVKEVQEFKNQRGKGCCAIS